MDTVPVHETSPSSASSEAETASLSATARASSLEEKQVPISLIANRYFLFNVDAVLHVRREHHICGTFVGGIPHVPHQNVFLGLPLELMPEEARLLVEQGHAHIVDDVKAHKKALWGEAENTRGGAGTEFTRKDGMSKEERKAVLHALKLQGLEAAKAAQKKSGEKREKALMEVQEKKDKRKKRVDPQTMVEVTNNKVPGESEPAKGSKTSGDASEPPSGLFQLDGHEPAAAQATSSRPSHQATKPTTTDRFYITPTTSAHILPSFSSSPRPDPSQSQISQFQVPNPPLPRVPASYPLFAHLHSKGYYLAPGLRFGCQYMAYPGDPLRYHSHFLANGLRWDEEFDLLDLVGGGRLGTGVKKSFVIGGLETNDRGIGMGMGDGGEGVDVDADTGAGAGHDDDAEKTVRTFSIEWAGM